MNYILNLFISQQIQNPGTLVGNFIGEFVKPSNYRTLSCDLLDGLVVNSRIIERMHRHPAFIKSRTRMNSKFSKYSTPVTELFYGHFLASSWSYRSDKELNTVLNNNYYILLENFDCVPYKMRKMLPVLMSPAGLTNLGTVAGLNDFISEMSRKGFLIGNLQNALQDLLNEYASFQNDFNEVMEEILPYISIAFSERESEKASNLVLAHAS